MEVLARNIAISTGYGNQNERTARFSSYRTVGCGKGTQSKFLINYLQDNNLGEVLYVYTGEN